MEMTPLIATPVGVALRIYFIYTSILLYLNLLILILIKNEIYYDIINYKTFYKVLVSLIILIYDVSHIFIYLLYFCFSNQIFK